MSPWSSAADARLISINHSAALNAMKADVSEAEAQLKYLEEQLTDLETQKAEHERAINEAKRIMDIKMNTNKTEISRLKGNPFLRRCTIGSSSITLPRES